MKEEEEKEKKRKIGKYFSSHKLLYAMLIPMLVYFLLFNYYPMLGLQIAFKDWNPWKGIWGSPIATTGGELDAFKHFKYLFFETEEFWEKFGNTLRISVLKMVFGFPMPILIAIFMNEMLALKYKKVVQTISYLPHFISWVIISGILLSMGSADSDFQLFLEKLFGKQIYFFNDDNYFLLLLVISDIWKGCGWGTIIYLAALASVPLEEYEAAVIDGAGRFQKIVYITFPAILPAVSIRLIFELSGLTSAGFDQIFNMYNSTVYGKGDVLETFLYRQGVIGGKYDLSTALGLFNSLIALFLTLVTNKIINKMGGEGIW
ncbi:MAG: sugar ABC transporter permease [Clostridia bacterium]|nr:sugar ABC transporter permease [Clostridia bacterium]